MRKQWEKRIYIARKLEGVDEYGKGIYEEPREYSFTVQPMSSRLDIQMFGERAIEMQRMLIERKKYENFFHEGDLVYLDGASPEGEEVNGINANYRMLPPRNQNLCITIYCARIVNKNG